MSKPVEKPLKKVCRKTRLKKLRRNSRRQELKSNYLKVNTKDANCSNLLQILNLFSGVLWEST